MRKQDEKLTGKDIHDYMFPALFLAAMAGFLVLVDYYWFQLPEIITHMPAVLYGSSIGGLMTLMMQKGKWKTCIQVVSVLAILDVSIYVFPPEESQTYTSAAAGVAFLVWGVGRLTRKYLPSQK